MSTHHTVLRRLRTRLALCAALALPLMLAAACDDDEEGGGNGDTSSDAMEVSDLDANDADVSDADDASDGDPDAEPDTSDTTSTDTSDTTSPGLPYRFVRIDDQGDNGDTIDAGADIDAVVLSRGNEAFFAQSVEAFEHGGGFASEVDPNDVVGPPDAFSAWPDTSVCDLSFGYVSLGGLGGLLIVGMSQDIETGDTLTVLEVGGCDGNEGAPGIPDPIEVSVSVGNDIDGSWVFVGSGTGPAISSVVPTLPGN